MQAQEFSSQPRAVAGGTRPKYREHEDEPSQATNIMHDRRVVRGNTYAALVIPEDDPAEIARHREAQRRKLNRVNASKTKRAGTPEPVPGRHHMDVQTDTYLEELTERTVEFEAETQTDFLLDRPATPLFIPSKIGQDAACQIEDGDLFDFNTEVEPILEVLVGKTLERSMMEVLEEEELDAMRRHQDHFQQLREQELVEVQRMEAAEKRRVEEIGRRKEQTSAKKELEAAVVRKILSRNIARSYLSGIKERCFQSLHDVGLFRDKNLVVVESLFSGWLVDEVQKQIASRRDMEANVDKVIEAVVESKTMEHSKVLARLSDELDVIENAERKVRDEAAEKKRLEKMEQERIAAEAAAIKEWDQRHWIIELAVTAVNEDGSIVLGDDSTWTVGAEDGNAIDEAHANEIKENDAAGFLSTVKLNKNLNKIESTAKGAEKPVEAAEEEAPAEE